MSLPYDIEISPSEDCRKRVTQILSHVGKFIASHDNGIKQAEPKQIEEFCASLLKERVFLAAFVTYKTYYELEIELEYVKVKCRLSRI
jgi:hypothetical protein